METFLQDLRYGVRALVRSPVISVLAVVSLGLGIGANAAIFAAADVFLFRPLPFPDADRLAQAWTTNEDRGWTRVSLSIPDALDYREWTETTELAAWRTASMNLAGEGEPERIRGYVATANLFRVIGFRPSVGRGFTPDEEEPGNDRVAVVSLGLWERRYGGDPGVVGRTVRLDGEPHTIVGALTEPLPSPFSDAEIFVPLAPDGTESRAARPVSAIVRLKPGVPLERARAEFSRMAARLAEAYPAADAGNGANLIPLRDQLFSPEDRQAATIVMVAVGFVLLIACANVANLLLTRATRRNRELAVRTALGAGKGRIARQLLTESTVLGAVGGAVGVIVAVAGLRWILSILPPFIPRLDEIAINLRVLVFLTGTAVVSGIAVGVLPAARASRPDLRASLQEGGRGGSAGRSGGRIRSGLVVAQVALALVLLVSSGLLVKGFLNVHEVELGFRADDVLTLRTSLPEAKYPDDDALRGFWDRVRADVAALPGAEAAALTSSAPSDPYGSATYYNLEGDDVEEGRRPVVAFRRVGDHYFEALGIDVVRGRGFDARDRPGAPEALVVNETFAERHFPDGDALGRRVEFSTTTREIVGVVEDIRTGGPDSDHYPVLYFSSRQDPARTMTLVVRGSGDAGALTAGVRDRIRALDPAQPVYDVRMLTEWIAEDVSGNTVMAQIMGSLAVIALLLALVGVYGVISYSVARRSREMGLRMALGARGSDVRGLIVRRGAKLAGIGVGIGFVGALGASRALAAFLFGVEPWDPATFGVVTVSLFAAAVLASWFPAVRATRVDPVVALRNE